MAWWSWCPGSMDSRPQLSPHFCALEWPAQGLPGCRQAAQSRLLGGRRTIHGLRKSTRWTLPETLHPLRAYFACCFVRWTLWATSKSCTTI